MNTNTIYHGDNLDILPTFPNNSIDMIITDPPYGIDYQSNKQLGNTRKGYTETTRETFYFNKIPHDDRFPTQWLPLAYNVLKENTALYIFAHWKTIEQVKIAVAQYFTIKNIIVLHKSNHGMGDLQGSFAPKYELLIYATKGRHILQFPEKRLPDVWDVKVIHSKKIRHHPNQKRLDWHTLPIQCSSQENDIILDPFSGIGSACAEASRLNRQYIGIELQHHYIKKGKKQYNKYLK